MIGEALRENTVSMGGAYGELVQSVMKTDVMNDFFAAYLSSVIRSEVYGEQYEEIAEDDLMQAFSSAIDEMENVRSDPDLSGTGKHHKKYDQRGAPEADTGPQQSCDAV